MHDLITGCYPPEPLQAAGPLNNPTGANSFPAAYAAIRNIDGVLVEPFYTHGKALVETTMFGPEFISLLLRCLADQPAHRPTLEELERWVISMEADPANNEPDDFFQQAFGEAPEVSCGRLHGCLRSY